MNPKRSLPPFFLSALILVAGVSVAGVEPSPLINYQGVLRDAADTPLEGSHDMIFRFYDAQSGGDECLVDEHLASGTGGVMVGAGLFNVALGSGNVYDGGGPGTYDDLAGVFRDYAAVYLEVQIDNGSAWETLSPRIRVLPTAYALNADHLDGNDASAFLDTSALGQSKSGPLELDASGHATYGLQSYGDSGGGYFADADETGIAYLGYGHTGIEAYGQLQGALFEDTNQSGFAQVAYGDRGIRALGNQMGGSFQDRDNGAYSFVGYGDTGIEAYGDFAGGYFEDMNQSGYAHVGYGDRGIRARGNQMGGSFQDADNGAFSYVGYGNRGIHSEGIEAGGYFRDDDDSGYAWVGYGDRGILAYGDEMGGYFQNTVNTATHAKLATSFGVEGHGFSAGGYFTSTYPGASVDAYVGYQLGGDEFYAFRGFASAAGGYFADNDSSGYTYAGFGSYKVFGNGSVNFVQNHPHAADRSIVYAAPEGDEVATYTRGTARLIDGEARVRLGETFEWVTNPDIGLTVHLTPVGAWSDLYVVAKSTREIVVRSRDGAADVAFDYLVHGLRIGFEETSVVREKTRESFIPSMEDHRELYRDHPELRRFNALERFKTMAADVDRVDFVDLSRADELRAAIQEYDLEVHGPVESLLGHGPGKSHVGDSSRGASTSGPSVTEADEVTAGPESVANVTGAVPIVYSERSSTESSPQEADALSPRSWNEVWMPVSEPVEAGDVLVLDPERPGLLRRAEAMADAAVAGIAAGPAHGVDAARDGETLLARVALGGLVECKVDAGYGAIRLGDPLTTSPTPGHAMRALEVVPGTILGKAAEPLEVGVGTIKVLVTLR